MWTLLYIVIGWFTFCALLVTVLYFRGTQRRQDPPMEADHEYRAALAAMGRRV